ncbi:MAG: diguanylate cyclase domain-containing protein [Desulfovermiculus sp.]
MNSEHIRNGQAELERLQSRKRRVYLIALICGVFIFLLSWTVRDPGDVFIEIMYPIFALVLAGFFPLVWRGYLPLRQIEIPLLAIVGAMIFSRLAWHFHFAGDIDDRLLVLAGGHYWAVGGLAVAAFAIFDRRQGLLAGVLIICLSLILAGTGIAGESLSGDGVNRETIVYLLRIHVFLALLLVLTYAVTTMRDELHGALIRAEVMGRWATTDILTGLANRRAAEQFLNQQVALVSRYGRTFSVISADVDKFKPINDTYGHAKGDEVLTGIGRILADSVRESDFVARWGGDEFLVVAPDTSAASARQLMKRCWEAIENASICGIPIRMTFGAAEFRPGDSLDDVLARADVQLYREKRREGGGEW